MGLGKDGARVVRRWECNDLAMSGTSAGLLRLLYWMHHAEVKDPFRTEEKNEGAGNHR